MRQETAQQRLETRKICLPWTNMMGNPTPDSPPMPSFLICHPQDDNQCSHQFFNLQIALSASKFIHALKSLERVPNERQSHISRLLVVKRRSLGSNYCRIVVLINIVNREIGHVSGGVEAWLEGSAD